MGHRGNVAHGQQTRPGLPRLPTEPGEETVILLPFPRAAAIAAAITIRTGRDHQVAEDRSSDAKLVPLAPQAKTSRLYPP